LPAQQSIIDLYNFANRHEVSSVDRRTQQLVYHSYLILNQRNLLLILFGNGFLTHFAELTLEMEIPALLFNFGLIGFTLFFVPFLLIFLYSLYYGMKNIKKTNQEYIMLLTGCLFTFVLAFFTGVTFFHSSSMIIIIILNVLLLNTIKTMEAT